MTKEGLETSTFLEEAFRGSSMRDFKVLLPGFRGLGFRVLGF